LEDLHIRGRVLKWILKIKDEREGNVLMWFGDKQGVLWAW